MKKGFPAVIAIAGFIILLDQLTKMWATNIWQTTPWAPMSWFSFIYSENHGIAFGLPLRGVILLFITAVLILGLIWYAASKFSLEKKSHQLVMAMVLGGAIGNFIDRIRWGMVRDFIQIGIWPTFNVADMAIVGGVILVFIIAHKK